MMLLLLMAAGGIAVVEGELLAGRRRGHVM